MSDCRPQVERPGWHLRLVRMSELEQTDGCPRSCGEGFQAAFTSATACRDAPGPDIGAAAAKVQKVRTAVVPTPDSAAGRGKGRFFRCTAKSVV